MTRESRDDASNLVMRLSVFCKDNVAQPKIVGLG